MPSNNSSKNYLFVFIGILLASSALILPLSPIVKFILSFLSVSFIASNFKKNSIIENKDYEFRYKIIKLYLEASDLDLFNFDNLEKLKLNSKLTPEIAEKCINKEKFLKTCFSVDLVNKEIGDGLDNIIDKYLSDKKMDEILENLYKNN